MVTSSNIGICWTLNKFLLKQVDCMECPYHMATTVKILHLLMHPLS